MLSTDLKQVIEGSELVVIATKSVEVESRLAALKSRRSVIDLHSNLTVAGTSPAGESSSQMGTNSLEVAAAQ